MSQPCEVSNPSFASMNDSRAWSYLTADLPGIGGSIKQQPEDFIVEEIPAYTTTQEGEHLFVKIEKRNLSTGELLSHLSNQLSISQRAIGIAGMKDKRAITRQFISVPASCQPLLSNIETSQITILEQSRHRHKLKTGHLKENHFSILIRDVKPHAKAVANKILDVLKIAGAPNYFGNQRFGHHNSTVNAGFKLLNQLGHHPSKKSRVSPYMKRLRLSAVQSWLFNHLLCHRIRSQVYRQVLNGDVMQVRESGGLFRVEEELLHREQQRFNRAETSITGPLFGPKMKQTALQVHTWETEALSQFQLKADDFLKFPKLTSGTRRSYRTFFTEISLKDESAGLRLQFTLPKGAYATTLLREIMKTPGNL